MSKKHVFISEFHCDGKKYAKGSLVPEAVLDKALALKIASLHASETPVPSVQQMPAQPVRRNELPEEK